MSFSMNSDSHFHFQWHDEERSILILTFPRYYNVSELQGLLLTLQQMIDHTNALRVDTILLLHKSQVFGGSDLLTLLHTMSLRIPDVIHSLIHVDASTFTYMLTQNIGLLNRRYRNMNHFVKTLDEALSLIDELRKSPES